MDNSTLKEILKVKIMSFTKEEIEDIMNSELEKTPEEMDTELIDMCLDILTEEPKERADEKLTGSSAGSEKKVKIFNFKKGILIAAIITLLIMIAIPAGAKIFDIDVPESMLKVYEEYFRLDMDGGDRSEELSVILAENELTDLVLPRYLYTECNITGFKIYDENQTNQVAFNYVDKKQNITGTVTLNNSDIYVDFLDGETLINNQYEKAKRITVNGIDVFVFNEGNEIYIVYSANGIEYNIMLYGATIEQAVVIAVTL